MLSGKRSGVQPSSKPRSRRRIDRRALKAAQEVAGLLCGWSRASRGAAEELDFEQPSG